MRAMLLKINVHFIYLIILSGVVTLSSCQTNVAIPSPAASQFEAEDDAFIESFAKAAGATHILIGCHIFDLKGKMVKHEKWNLCQFNADGHSTFSQNDSSNDSLFELDERSNVLWKVEPILAHHALSKSQFKNEYLTLTSEYVDEPDKGKVRYDRLVVIQSGGKVAKSFKFSEYVKKNPKYFPATYSNMWTADGMKDKSVEYTHGNSFREMTHLKNGKKVHTGYVYYSLRERMIYFFDSKLKRITDKIPSRDEAFHDIQQYDEDNLIAYGNSVPSNPFGAVFLINIKNKKFTTLYQFTDKRQASIACGSVQVLPGEKLFLIHSKCFEHVFSNETGFYLEFVDLKKGKSILKYFNSTPQQSAKLVDLSSYLANSLDN